MSALDLGGTDASFASLASGDRFAGVTLLGAGPGLFVKKPAMLDCFWPGFCMLEEVLFFMLVFCVLASFSSTLRAITPYNCRTLQVKQVQEKKVQSIRDEGRVPIACP